MKFKKPEEIPITFPHMLPAENRIFYTYLKEHFIPEAEYYFDIHVGKPVIPESATSPKPLPRK